MQTLLERLRRAAIRYVEKASLRQLSLLPGDVFDLLDGAAPPTRPVYAAMKKENGERRVLRRPRKKVSVEDSTGIREAMKDLRIGTREYKLTRDRLCRELNYTRRQVVGVAYGVERVAKRYARLAKAVKAEAKTKTKSRRRRSTSSPKVREVHAG